MTPAYYVYILLVFLLIESKPSKTAEPKPLTATIINADPNEPVFCYYVNNLNKTVQARLRPGRSTTITFDQSTFLPQMVYIPYKMKHIGLGAPVMPGDTIYVRHNSAQGTYNFTGNHPAELSFFKEIGESNLNLGGFSRAVVPYGYSMPFEEFLQNWQQVWDRGEQIISRLKATPEARPEIKAYFERELRLRIFITLLNPIPDRNSMEPKRPLPQFYQDTVRSRARMLEKFKTLPSYSSQRLVFALRSYTEFLCHAQDIKPEPKAMYEMAKKEFTGFQRDWVCFLILQEGQEDYHNVRPLLKDYLKTVSPENRFAINLLEAEQANSGPFEGKVSLNDVLVDMDGKTVPLLNFVSQNKGKVIYLDLWASWCAPCIAELPASAQIREQYGPRGLVTAYLSVDEKEGKWLAASARHLLGAPNSYRFTDRKEAGFLDNFKVQSIPRYMLIDKEGIIRYASAPSPSDPRLKEVLEELL